MKGILLTILLLGHLSLAEEKADHQKFLEAMQGKWATTLSGNIIVGKQEPQKIHVHAQTHSELFFGSFILEKTITKTKDAGAVKITSVYEVTFYDNKKSLMSVISFNGESGIYTQNYKVQSPEKMTLIFKEKKDLTENGYYEFIKQGKERVGGIFSQNKNFTDIQVEMNWVGLKVDKFDKPFAADKPAGVNEKINKYKTDDHKWIVQSQYLIKENKKSIEIIGLTVAKKEVRKFVFSNDGSVKAFSPQDLEGKIKWKEVDYISKLPKQ